MKSSAIYPPRSIHGIPVLTPAAAAATGYKSITVDICAEAEKKILAGVCQWRNPKRCCLAHQGDHLFQLCILREDVLGSDTETD